MARKGVKRFEEAKATVIWKVAVYIRLSKEDGNEQSLSVVNQRMRLLNYLEASDEAFELVEVYTDDGFTGTDSNRVAFQRMLGDIRSGKVNCVLVKDTSRLSRNYIEAGHYMEQLFVTHNVRFISLELPALDSYKFPEQMNSIVVPIQNVINDDFCRQTSIKIRGVFNAKRRNGDFIGGFAPYGYIRNPQDKRHFIIDEEAAAVVRDIFRWFVYDGLSKNGIARKLNSMGLPNPSRYKKQCGMKYRNHLIDDKSLWSLRTVDVILHNMTYLGCMVQGKQRVKSYKVHKQEDVPQEEWFVVENMHEPIIEQEIFDKAQLLMQRDTRVAPWKKKLYLFSGMLRCADCGRSMTRRSFKQYAYYACSNYLKFAPSCTRHSIREDTLYAAVLQAVQKQIELVENLQQLIDEIDQAPIIKRKSTSLTALLRLRRQELERALDIKDSIFLDWKKEIITQTDFLRLQEKMNKEIYDLQQVVNALVADTKVMEIGVEKDDPYLALFLEHRGITSLDRGLLVELIQVIDIHENNEVTIRFNFSDQYQRLLEHIDKLLAYKIPDQLLR